MNPRERNMAALTAVVVGGALLWTMGLEPALASFRRDGDRLEGLEKLVAAERGLVASLEGDKGLRAQRESLNRRLRPDAAVGFVPGVVDALRGLSRAAGFEPAWIRPGRAQPLVEPTAPGQPPKASPFAELRFELRAKVSLEALQKFLVSLAAAERPVRVVGLSISPRTDGPDLDVDVSLLGLAPREALLEKPK